MLERTPLSNTISAFSLIIAMLVEDLEKTGAISRKDFAKRLKNVADNAEKTAPEHLKAADRLDLKIARNIAGILHKDNQPGPQKGWKPIVIDGGLLNNPGQDQN